MGERFPKFEIPMKETEDRSVEEESNLEKLSDDEIEHIIGESTYVNSGNNGVILRIDLEKIPELKKLIGDKTQSKAIKLLKVHRPGEGVKEYVIQTNAFNIVNTSPEKDKLAKIPAPLLFRDIKLSRGTSEYLQGQGVEVSDHAEVLLMDFVEGEDLATKFDKWVIEKANPDRILPRSNNFEDLHLAVSQILKFENPGGKATREGDRAYEERKIQMGNADKLYKTLKKTGFSIDAEITTKLKKTIDLLHKNGIYHNDPHERNFMIDKDDIPYIVDFGSASNDIQEDRVADEYIINRLKELNEEKIDYGKILYEISLRLSKDQAWQKKQKDFIENLPQSLKNFDSQLISSSSNEFKFESLLAIAYEALKKEKISKKEFTALLNKVSTSGRLPPWAFNKVNKLSSSIE